MNKYFLLLLLQFFSFFLAAQLPDSLIGPIRWRGDEAYKMNLFDKAVEHYDSALVNYEFNENWEQVVYCYRWKGNSLFQGSRYEEAVHCLEQGLEVCNEKYPNPGAKIGFYISLGSTLEESGEIIKGLDYLGKAEELMSGLLPPNHPALGNVLNAQSVANSKMGDYPRAIKLLERSLEISLQNREAFPSGVYQVYNNLGVTYRGILDYEKSLEYFEKSIKEMEDLNVSLDDPDWARTYNGLAITYEHLRDFNKAREYYDKGLENSRKNLGEKSRLTFDLTLNKSSLYRKEEDWENALVTLIEAKEIADSIWQKPIDKQAIIYLNLGIIYEGLGEEDKAIDTHLKGVTVAEKIPGFSHLAINLAGLGNAYWNFGDFEQGIATYHKVIDVYKKRCGEDCYELPKAYQKMAEFQLKMGEIEQADYYVNAGLKIFCPEWDSNEDFIPRSYCKVNNTDYIDLLHLKSSIAQLKYENTGDKALAEQGLSISEFSIQIAEDFRRRMNLNNPENVQWLTDNENLYKQGINLAVQAYTATGNDQYKEKAFQLADQHKSMLLREGLQRAEASSFFNLPEEKLEEERALSNQILVYEKAYQEALLEKDTAKILLFRDEYLFPLKRSYEDLVAALESEYPNYYEMKFQNPQVQVSIVQDQLSEEEVFISYSINKENEKLHAFIIDEKGLNVHTLKLDSETDKRVRDLKVLLESLNLQRADRRRRFIKLSSELYEQFITGIEEDLKGKQKLIICGEGISNYLPFEVLLSKSDDLPYTELDFLIKDYEISYHYSAALFLKTRKKEVEYDQDLLAFAPVFGEENESYALRGMEGNNLRSFKEGQFQPLEHTETEVMGIQSLFRDLDKTKVLLREAASESNFKTELSSNYRFVHVATHSFANIDFPKFSGIACSNYAQSNDSEDGILYVGEVYNIPINSDLVILSSCESGIGKLISGEGMLGLNRSFVYAGVPNVIYSLWKVYDKTSSQLMVKFYEEVLAGSDYRKALRKAKLEMMANKTTASPDFWSAFLLVGR